MQHNPRIQGYLDEYADQREILVRAKWSLDGAKTLRRGRLRLHRATRR